MPTILHEFRDGNSSWSPAIANRHGSDFTSSAQLCTEHLDGSIHFLVAATNMETAPPNCIELQAQKLSANGFGNSMASPSQNNVLMCIWQTKLPTVLTFAATPRPSSTAR